METSKSIQVVIAKQIWKLIRISFRFLKRGISNSNLLKPLQNDVVCPSLKEYEFSCSNSPAYAFLPLSKKHRRRRSLRHNRCSYRVDEAAVAAAVQRVFDMLNAEAEGPASSAAGTPMVMPGFGETPVRQLRVTDSPFPEAKGSEEEEAQVSKAAEDFIRRFYGDLRREKSMALAVAFRSPCQSCHHFKLGAFLN